jgi:hypothetical protein
LKTYTFYKAVASLGLFATILIIPTPFTPLNTIRHSYALQQLAGNIIIETMPGETETFNWGLISDKNASVTVNITADGTGAEYLSFPENITLPVGENVTYIPVNVSIPANYTGSKELTTTITATEEAGEEVGNTIINIGVSKILCIVVGAENNATTMTTSTTTATNSQQQQNTTRLELKDFTQEVIIGNNTSGNQSIITIPIKSTSENITGFTFNHTRNEISFTATGDAGTNGTTIIYAEQILQEPYSLVVDRIPSNGSTIVTNSTTAERGIQVTYQHHCIDNDVMLRGSEIRTPTENIP